MSTQPENFVRVGETRFWIDGSLATEIRGAIEPLLLKHAEKIPRWCGRVSVYWNESATFAAATTTFYDYRRAELTIGPNFISLHQRRELNIVHELMHLYTEPLANAAKDARDALKKTNEAAAEIVTEAIRHAGEQTVVDLTDLLIGET
jgi:hypothetical protein